MNTGINLIDIIALQNIENCGIATVRKICDYLLQNHISITAPTELYDIFPELRLEKIINSRLDEVGLNDIKDAYRKADRILLTNDRLGINAVSVYDDRFPAALKIRLMRKENRMCRLSYITKVIFQ